MEAHREIGWEIAWGSEAIWWGVYPLAIIAFIALAYIGIKRYFRWRDVGKQANIFVFPRSLSDAWTLSKRVKGFISVTLSDILLERRFLQNPYAGIMHIFIFLGCFLLILGAGMDFIFHYDGHLMTGKVYEAFSCTNDIGGVLVLVGVVMAAIERYIRRPDRLDNRRDDWVSLLLIAAVVITGFVLAGARIAAQQAQDPLLAQSSWEKWGFLSYGISLLFDNIGSPNTVLNVYRGLWWFHILFTSGAVIYIILSFHKLTHILISPANVFFRSLRPKGALLPCDLDAETFGVSKLSDFTWKDLFDLDACTRCGRCQDNCPAYLSGKPLSPKNLIQDLKSALWDGNHDGSLIGEVIGEEVLWSCTTCRACMEACPVYVEHIDKVVDMRRSLVLEQGKIPEVAQGILKSIETRGHSCRGTTYARTDWIQDLDRKLDVKLMSDVGSTDVLLWVGCQAGLEDRSMNAIRALAHLLQISEVNFAILGEEEKCCGDPARRMGNEYLFQMFAEQNIDTLLNYDFKKIVTLCPHGFNVFKNEYPQLGAKFEVLHHTQFLLELIKSGRLKVQKEMVGLITYHDSCYLGRHNNIYEEPRNIIKSIPGAKMVEMSRNKVKGFCCGGGGGEFWLEESISTGARINQMRAEQVIETKASVVVTACPFCLQMLEDGIKAKEAEENLRTLDIAEILERYILDSGGG
jgi:Fe-S oxidoreductase/nitrate reductase gamma subunit